MNDDTRRILDLLAAGKVTVAEAEELLTAVKEAPPADGQPAGSGDASRYLRIDIEKPAADGSRTRRVNLRVPIGVIRSGLRLGALLKGDRSGIGQRITDRLKAKGLDVIDLSALDEADLEEIIGGLGELSVDVDDGRAHVRISRE